MKRNKYPLVGLSHFPLILSHVYPSTYECMTEYFDVTNVFIWVYTSMVLVCYNGTHFIIDDLLDVGCCGNHQASSGCTACLSWLDCIISRGNSRQCLRCMTPAPLHTSSSFFVLKFWFNFLIILLLYTQPLFLWLKSLLLGLPWPLMEMRNDFWRFKLLKHILCVYTGCTFTLAVHFMFF